MAIFARVMDANHSFMRLPLWVRLWIVLLLGPINIAAFFFMDTPTGYWAAWATVFVILANSPILIGQRGWSKALAIPHLIVWIPLLFFVGQRLATAQLSDAEFYYAIALFVVDGISILFDLNDTRAWLRGDRGVA